MDRSRPQPPLPSEATPRAQLKRKHGEIVDPNQLKRGNNHEQIAAPGPGQPVFLKKATEPARSGSQPPEAATDNEDESDDDSMLEDILDTIELDPYVAVDEDNVGLSKTQCQQLHRELRKDGPEAFLDHYLTKSSITSKLTESNITPKLLGFAFGISPDFAFEDDDIFELVLRKTVSRAYKKRLKLAEYNTIDDAAKLLRSKKNIIVITGAGISTSLGIPDFRSQGTGFYDKVRAMGYGGGEDVFQIDEFDRDPTIFYSLAGDILPDLKRFSPTHAFVKLLQTKERLQTNYTQNIDNLEELAGIDKTRLIQCHGSFATASCRKCTHKVPGRAIFDDIRKQRVAKCKRCIQKLAEQPPLRTPLKKRKSKSTNFRKNDWEDSSDDDESAYDMPQPGVMKPDITFFGEKLANTFFDRFTEKDCKQVDLVIVIGTSLKVAPVSEMPNYLPHSVPHIYISREPIAHVNFDIQLLGECDHIVYELCRRAGWALKHEMIPKDFGVNVTKVEGYDCRWNILPKGKEVGEENVEGKASKPHRKPGRLIDQH
ncbi:NAD-dependent histone deacetylase sir2 [Recurvomyces mirabilis]|nr:NAD-dependent histone deacetylase sir2 [Recurvomyces mirabilis]